MRFRGNSRISLNWQRQGPKFRKLQEAIWLTVINEIFKFPPHLDLFGHENYLYKLSSGYPSYPTQKWYIWTSFQTSRKGLRKLQEDIWLSVINEIFKFLPHLHPYGQEDLYTRITQLKNDTFDLASRVLVRDFINYRKPYG